MTVAVTGASGHIGASLVRDLLSQGRRVRVLVHTDRRALEGLDVEVVSGDICDLDYLKASFSNIETVYHLAAVVSIYGNKWPLFENVNVEGTRNVVQACLDCGVKRLVHFSSIHAISQQPLDMPVDETSPLVPCRRYMPYDSSKAESEKEIYKGIQQGLDSVILSPTGVLGPYDFKPSLTGEVLLKMARGTLPGLVNGGFDWVDVRDITRAAVRAEQTAPAGVRYILSGHWASVKELAMLVEEITGTPAPGRVYPLWLAALAAPAITFLDRISGRRPLYTSASLKALHSNCHISHDKASRELGFSPRPLKETVADSLLWFKQNGWLNSTQKKIKAES